MTDPPPPASGPLHLTIRFSSSIPDLDLDIASPERTTVLSLKHLLRSRIDSRSRLRLIYQGHILPDPCALSAVLRPLPSAQQDDDNHAGATKGKAVAALLRIYVNCSIGDELSEEDLAAEEAAAHDPPADVEPGSGAGSSGRQPRKRPRPRGFDRFLQAGFTASEISTLRAQFTLIQSSRFLPDSMPSPDSMRSLEDAWIDSNAGPMPTTAAMMEDDGSIASYVDILIRGLAIGFFFPLGSFTWLLRGDVWNDKWRVFVAFGVILSVATGVVKGISEQR
ncbi:hypothetical protein CDD80_4112 [Ophiocordyceps camponoti-rufipedis]|uniref:Ubiquitin-like domain-containing protein n=1 Tax=Ophiocordyceps camponoti-rufipedis TaxID=2004952 RepID=A0A2C5Z1E7_9HYPO|nr:hypothetical protein CDD80_4112 [Ophiocordyceps camponoti-rufipedis]